MPTIVRDGTTLAYEEHGTGEPALVFVHGWTCDSSSWTEQVAAFSKKYRVITLDLPVSGTLDDPGGGAAERGDCGD